MDFKQWHDTQKDNLRQYQLTEDQLLIPSDIKKSQPVTSNIYEIKGEK